MKKYIKSKKKYIEAELEIIKLDAANIILESNEDKEKVTVTDWFGSYE